MPGAARQPGRLHHGVPLRGPERQAAVKRRGRPRGRALRRTPCCPFRLPGRKVVMAGGFARPRFAASRACRRRGHTTLAAFEKRVSGARLRGAVAHNSSSRPEAERYAGMAPLGRSVFGQLGETGRLGLARPGTAAEGREGAPESLRTVGPPRPARARSAASSVRLTHLGAGGALTRGGLRVPIDQWGGGGRHRWSVLWSVLWSVFWSVLRRSRVATRRQTETVRPRSTLPGRARRHAPVLISGLGKVGKSFGRVFQRKEGGDEPEATSGSAVTSRPPRRPAPPPACPPKATLGSHTRDGTGAPQIPELFPSRRGEGDKHYLRELRGARPARAARHGAPPSGY